MVDDNTIKVLLVEDDKTNRLLYSEYLIQNGFHVVSAQDGEVALKKFEESHFDIVLLDLMLPKIDGLKVLETIKTNPLKKHVKVYLLTVIGTENMIQKAFELGADGYLIKESLTPEDIKNEILQALSPLNNKPKA